MPFELHSAPSGVDYGIIWGSDTVVYLKTGLDGTLPGYGDKYLRIAATVNRVHGCTVVAASNPRGTDLRTKLQQDITYIENCVENIKEIYAFGHSNGAQMLLSFAFEHTMITRVLAVNSPLQIGYLHVKTGISRFQGERAVALYGEKDPSAPYLGLLRFCDCDALRVEEIEDADHHFTNMLQQFIDLPLRYLF